MLQNILLSWLFLECFTLECKDMVILQNIGNTHAKTQCHIPQELKSQQKVLKKFPSYKFILLVRGIFCLEFQSRSWLIVIILKVNIKIFLHAT